VKRDGLPEDPLRESCEIQESASRLGFDWPDITGVFEKVREELEEIESAWSSGNTRHAQRELGDVLFALVNLARFLNADPAQELERTNRRFSRRFEMLKECLRQEGKTVEDCTLAELDMVWRRVKQLMHTDESDA